MATQIPSQDALTVRRLRRGVGLVAMWLPLAVLVGHSLDAGELTLPGSVSGAYHTVMRDVFVGSLSAIGVFLINYRNTRKDDWLGTTAGVLAILVALFPTRPAGGVDSALETAVWIVHIVAAVLMFLTMAVFCFFVFPEPYPGAPKAEMTGRKRTRSAVYIISGWIVILALAVAGAASLVLPHDIETKIQPIFWGESLAMWAFGFAWLVKGNAIIKDSTPTVVVTTVEAPTS
jgi:hypothetical protein